MTNRIVSGLGIACAAAGLFAIVASPSIAGDEPAIVPRAEWGAKDATFAMPAHEIERITIHHTGEERSTKRPTVQLVRNLQNFSQSKGKLADGRTKKAWADVPYHFYIGRDGTIVEGRDPGFAGDTNTNYEPAGHLGIAVSGNYEVQELTDAQRTSLVALVDWAAKTYDVAPELIGGHGDHASTACPGKNLAAFLPELRERVAATP